MEYEYILSATCPKISEIRCLVREATINSSKVDNLVDGSNTLLHLAVKNDLPDCVATLLSSGADAYLPNNEGFSPIDCALDSGNQVLLQILSRRDDHGFHSQFFSKNFEVTRNVDGLDSSRQTIVDPEVSDENKMLLLSFGAIYEDYIDWTDSQRCINLQVIITLFAF